MASLFAALPIPRANGRFPLLEDVLADNRKAAVMRVPLLLPLLEP
jgi:hypothetical protein